MLRCTQDNSLWMMKGSLPCSSKGEADAMAESSQRDAEESRRDERLMWREKKEREEER